MKELSTSELVIDLHTDSPLLKTKAGVEMDSIASQVFGYVVMLFPAKPPACSLVARSANRDALSYNETVSAFLERAIVARPDDTAEAPPKPGEIDVIYAGCPCQGRLRVAICVYRFNSHVGILGFSSVNKAKKEDDLRCAEVSPALTESAAVS